MKNILTIVLVILSLGVFAQEDGEFIEYHKDKKTIKVKGYFKDGKKIGERFEYYKNGQLKEKGYYINNLKDGEWIRYYENGQLMNKGSFIEGEADGKFVYYFDDGQLGSESNHSRGVEHGEFTSYFQNGKIYVKYNSINGLLEGEKVTYYKDGKINIKSNYLKGLLNGELLVYNENGILIEKTVFIEGKKDGKNLFFNESGDLMKVINYEEDFKNGEYYQYYEPGKLKTKGSYKKGKRDGEWSEYYHDGKLKSKVIVDVDLVKEVRSIYSINGIKAGEVEVKTNSNIVAAGAYYMSEITLSKKVEGYKYVLSLNGKRIQDENEIAQIKFRATGGKYNKDGFVEKCFTINILAIDSLNVYNSYDFEECYFVKHPELLIESDKLLYLNNKNIIKIKCPDLGERYDPIFKVIGATLLTSENKDEVIIIPNSENIVLTVFNAGSKLEDLNFKAILKP